MNTKILPVIHPTLDSYSKVGHILSIVQSYNQTEDWLYSNFIQLVYKNYALVKYDTFNWFCPWIHDQKLSREFITIKWKRDFAEFLRDSIDLGYYIRFDIDHFYLDVSDSYLKNNRVHDIFVYGYSMENKMFYVSDNFRSGMYSTEMVKMEQVQEAFEQYISKNKPDHDDIKLMSFNANAKYQFDKKYVINALTNYLEAKDVSRPKSLLNEPVEGIAFGIRVYERLNEYYLTLIDDNSLIDLRGAHAIHKHKVLMLKRLEYLMSKKIIADGNQIYEQFKVIEKKSDLQTKILMKYWFTKKEGLLHRIISINNEIMIEEYETIQQLVKALERQ
ncbi:hypothetical protein [Paenibacillus camerounensis]|uniref:hypothetical protein n=1 Tax=Paenibacillus camerounensis TaxID=1243663 RepID=UPI0005AA0572|nr:hypothetical protein [Paenibacillus camerounensis]